MAKITVLIPVYNAEKYIKKAVESILKQTFTDFEFIIINDGSTDGTLEILESYALQDQRIRLISRENKGLIDTLNEGIALAKAPLIARMDADDIALPERLAIQYEFLQNNPGVVCVGSDCELIDHKGRCIGSIELAKASESIEKLLLDGECSIAHPTVMFLKSAVESVGMYKKNDYPAEDYALWVALLDVGKIENLSSVLLKYRIHAASVTQTSNIKMTKKTKEICEAACKKRGIPCEFDENTWLVSSKTRFKKTLGYGWYAFKMGRRWMALEYSLKAISQFPFTDGGWRLLICSLIKPLPKINK